VRGVSPNAETGDCSCVCYLECGVGAFPGRISAAHYLDFGAGVFPGRISAAHYLDFGAGAFPRLSKFHFHLRQALPII